MGTYKLTFPCILTDVNGNVVNTEKTVVFDDKEELIEYLSGDTDGDNHGSSLLRIKDFDKKLYEDIGGMCNIISHLLLQEEINKKQDTIKTCKQIVNYMMFPSENNAKKLYPMLQKTRLSFLDGCYYRMRDMDVDGDRPWEEEWCDKFMGMIRTDIKAFTTVMTHAANDPIDAWKD